MKRPATAAAAAAAHLRPEAFHPRAHDLAHARGYRVRARPRRSRRSRRASSTRRTGCPPCGAWTCASVAPTRRAGSSARDGRRARGRASSTRLAADVERVLRRRRPRRPAAGASARGATTWSSSRSEEASAKCRSSSRISSGCSAAAAPAGRRRRRTAAAGRRRRRLAAPAASAARPPGGASPGARPRQRAHDVPPRARRGAVRLGRGPRGPRSRRPPRLRSEGVEQRVLPIPASPSTSPCSPPRPGAGEGVVQALQLDGAADQPCRLGGRPGPAPSQGGQRVGASARGGRSLPGSRRAGSRAGRRPRRARRAGSGARRRRRRATPACVAPSAYTSLRGVPGGRRPARAPCTAVCRPALPRAGRVGVAATPKSPSAASPSASSQTLSGLTSRWTIPCAWAWASASATSRAARTPSGPAARRGGERSASEPPLM